MTTTLADVDRAFQETLHLPDLGALHVVLATIAANRMTGEPVWLLLIGPPASAKTETVETLGELPEVFTLSTTTKAGLLSGSGGTGGTGGVLVEGGEQFVLVMKEFTTLCSEHASTRNEVLALFREMFDGTVERAVGTGNGRVLKWKGHAGCIACATEAVDTIDMANFGERWVRYRLPKTSDEDRLLAGIVAMENVGRQREQRARRTKTVTEFFADLVLPDRPPEAPLEEQNRVIELADLGSRCRSPVVWGGRHGDEIVQVPSSEEVSRLVGELGQLSAGLVGIGVADSERWRILTKCARDGMATVRRSVIEVLVRATVDLPTSTVAARCRLPQSSVRRHLQELNAHGLCDLTGDNPERWTASTWLRESWRVVDAPPPTAEAVDIALNGACASIQGVLQ